MVNWTQVRTVMSYEIIGRRKRWRHLHIISANMINAIMVSGFTKNVCNLVCSQAGLPLSVEALHISFLVLGEDASMLFRKSCLSFSLLRCSASIE